MLKYLSVVFVFLVVSMNAYSQKRNCSDGYPFYMSGDTIIYTDSVIKNGLTVYTDSLVVKISTIYLDSVVIDGSIVYTDSAISYEMDYPITLKDNPLFKKAIYRDYCEFINLINDITFTVWAQVHNSDEKKGYYILSSDDRFINYAFLTKKDNRELYAKYNPVGKDNSSSLSSVIRTIRENKLMRWVRQEMKKGLIVSIGSRNGLTYIGKSFTDL